jgi:predicted RNA-binding Zn-ribbon protein involved in translation (DUF1610 family)
MALKFKCKNCGEDIIAESLKTEQIAKCKHCGVANEVPKIAMQSDEESPVHEAPRMLSEEQSSEKAIQKIAIDVVDRMKCPSCGESEVSTQTVINERKPRKAVRLIGGLVLFLLGLVLACMTIAAFLDPVLMQLGNPGPMGAVAAALLVSGCSLIIRYISVSKTKLFNCRCDSCGHQWQDEKSGTLVSLIESLNNESGNIRERAVRALGDTGDARAVEPLIRTLNDESSRVRDEVVTALRKIGGARAVEFIARAGHDKSLTVRGSAFNELRKIRDKRAVEPLINALKDENYGVRMAAANALGDIGDERAQDALTQAREDDSRYVRNAAKKALYKIKAKKS